MKVIIPGHEYELLSKDGKRIVSHLQFIQKKKIGDTLKLVKEGTTSEEVIDVLVDRIEHLDTVLPHKENKKAISALQEAKAALERRTKDREKRKVEGTGKK